MKFSSYKTKCNLLKLIFIVFFQFMEQGKVKWFDTAKGYGFIQADDNSQDVFVHHSEIVSAGYKKLSVGQIIHYDIQTRNDKPNAVNLKLI